MFILSTVIAGATGTAVGTLIGAGTTAAACTVQGTEAAARQLA